MKMNTTQQDKKPIPYSFLNLSLDYANQIKAEIICESSENILKQEHCTPYQKQSSNFNYNSFTKQILLQKSFSPAFTPKKQSSEEIFQYLLDRQYNKNQTQNTTEKPHLNSSLKPSTIQELHIQPFQSIKIEHQTKQILCQTYPKLKINDQLIEQMKSDQIQLDYKEDDKSPKKGLTYISKKLSHILRQKKRIKSSELFAISFFDEDEDNQNEEKNSKTKAPMNENENTGLKLQNEPNQLKESKQRRNVRRRIYDSINVMVALGVIKKFKNEYIYIEQKDNLNEFDSLIQQQDILTKKKDYLSKLENDCLYKEKCLNYLTESYSKMKIIRKINVQYEEKINPTNQNTRSSSQLVNGTSEQKIQFPFILMENQNHNLKIQLRSDSEDPQKLRKVNDWTDYIEVSNPNKESEIQVIRIKGKNLRVITDVDCINLLGSLQINEHADLFNKNQTDILRDYDIINQHKLKKSEESSKNSQKASRD